MRTFSLLKGMPVYGYDGELLGEVLDILISGDGTVTDLLLQGKGLIGRKCRLPVASVSLFGENALLLDCAEVLSAYEQKNNEYTMTLKRPLAGKAALSEEGESLGLLDDVYFLEEMGTIVAYELTDGFFSDITQGKRVIRTPNPPQIGKDAIIMSVK